MSNPFFLFFRESLFQIVFDKTYTSSLVDANFDIHDYKRFNKLWFTSHTQKVWVVDLHTNTNLIHTLRLSGIISYGIIEFVCTLNHVRLLKWTWEEENERIMRVDLVTKLNKQISFYIQKVITQNGCSFS